MAGRRSRRFLWLLLLVLAAAAVGFCRALRDPWPAQQGVVVPEGEERDTARVVAATVALVDSAHAEGRPFTRSAFAKAHACVRATVDVAELEPRLRHGLFARPGRYDAWIRFSNGAGRAALGPAARRARSRPEGDGCRRRQAARGRDERGHAGLPAVRQPALPGRERARVRGARRVAGAGRAASATSSTARSCRGAGGCGGPGSPSGPAARRPRVCCRRSTTAAPPTGSGRSSSSSTERGRASGSGRRAATGPTTCCAVG